MEAVYLNTQEVSQRTGLSVSFFNQRRVKGDGPPFVKAGRAVRYYWPFVVEWLNARASASTSEPAHADQAA